MSDAANEPRQAAGEDDVHVNVHMKVHIDVSRVRSEFLEMPGLRLTPRQAARLWALDLATSERVLEGLRGIGFLARNRAGAYSVPSIL